MAANNDDLARSKKKIELHLTGPSRGGPSFDDIMKLFTSLTGRTPTADELAEAKTSFDAQVATLADDGK